jgi:aspartate/methionine/tyrosine aminotransferase
LKNPPEWYASINEEYMERRVLAAELFNILGVKFDDKQAGMFLWGQIPKEFFDSYAFSDCLLKHHSIFITPGSIFGSNGARYTRISLCSNQAIFTEAIERIKNNVESTKKQVRLCG